MRLPPLTAGALAGLCLCLTSPPARTDGPPITPTAAPAPAPAFHPAVSGLRRTAVVEAVERVRAAVVNIHSERTIPGAELTGGAAAGRVNGMGTGIVLDPRGYIVTNQHVVDDVQVLRVRLADGSTYPARVVARDPEQDLALLKIDAPKPLQVMPLGTASDLMVGEPVIAVGNAFGYEHTVSVGVVSAINRDVTLNREVSYRSLIQTDASINPGNSGGPLLNIQGELIGVNVAIRAGAQGIGFAIPVDNMLKVAADLLSRRRGGTWHGLAVRDSVEISGGLTTRRAVVEKVAPNSPAAAAGLQPGDVLFRVAGQPVTTRLELERALIDLSTGDKVSFAVRRADDERGGELVLQTLDRPAPAGDLIWKKLGVRIGAVSPELVTRVNAQLDGGLLITEINPESPAAAAGFQRGDILVGLHQWKTVSADNVLFVLTHPDLASMSPLRFFIIRGGQVRRGHLTNLD